MKSRSARKVQQDVRQEQKPGQKAPGGSKVPEGSKVPGESTVPEGSKRERKGAGLWRNLCMKS